MKTKIIAMLLAAIMVLTMSACALSPDNTDGTTTADAGTNAPADTTTSGVEPPYELLDLVRNGETAYTIIRAENPTEREAIIKACQRLISTVLNKTGVRLGFKDDWLMKNETPGEYEIIVGATGRAESAAALKAIEGDHGYSISVVEKKLIICGADDTSTVDAMNYFIDNYIETLPENTPTVSIGKTMKYEYKGDNRINSMKINGTELSEFSLVLPDNESISEYRLAVYLNEYFLNYYGRKLALDNDTSDRVNEIRIGKTKRTVKKADGQSFTVRVTDGDLEISAGSPYAYVAALEYLTNVFMMPTPGSIEYANGFVYSKDISDTLTDGTENILTRSGTYRVMFSNVYGNCQAIHPVAQRNRMMVETFLQYLPDVLGMQECHQNSRAGSYAIDGMLCGTGLYAEVNVGNIGQNNFTPLFYRTDKLKVKDCGWLLYGDKNNDGTTDKSKSLTWAVFESLENGEKFAVISTHFCYVGADKNGNEARIADADKMVGVINTILNKYPDIAVMTGGDYNCNISSDPYKKAIAGGLSDVFRHATEAEDMKSIHTYPVFDTDLGLYTTPSMPVGTHAYSIDQILFRGNLKINLYDVITDEYMLLSSDHCPVYIDFDLNK